VKETAETSRAPKDDEAAMDPWSGTRSSLAVVVAAAFLVFAGSLKNEFVYDDLVDIREVDNVYAPGAWMELFQTASARLYRPFKYLSYRVDNVIWGWSPMGWHLASNLYHCLVCVLLLSFLRRLGLSPPAALAGALWYAVHPIHTEAVVWISSRASLFSTAAVLGICIAYHDWRTSPSKKSLAIMGGWAFFGFFSKEDALMVFPLLGAMELFLLSEGGFAFLKRASFWKPILVMAPIAALYLGLRQSILSGLAQGAWEHGFAGLAATLPVILVRYLGQIVFPVSMTVDQPLDYESGFGAVFVLSLALVAALAAVVLASKPELRRWKFPVAWFFITLVPVMGFIPINQPIADRFVYLPSVAAALALGWAWDSVDRHLPKHRQSRVILLGAVLAAYAISSISYTRAWRDERTLWQHVVEKNPQSRRGWLNLGVMANNVGQYEAALPLIERSLTIRPGDPEARVAMAYALSGLGRHHEAAAVYRQVLAGYPDNTIWMNLLAHTLQQAGDLEEAEAVYRRIFELRPNYAAARFAAGLLAARQGRLDRAIEHWEVAARLDPDNETVRRNLDLARRKKAEGQ